MIEKIMKAVKRGNKKRSRNITIDAVIGFLLSCTAVMGADNYLWIRENSGAIEFINQETTSSDGSDGTWSEENPYEDAGNIWDTVTKTYTNNITLSSSGANGADKNGGLSYGLRLSGNSIDVNFVNNASITGIMTSSGNGYGIYNSAKMGYIKNTGIINGTGDIKGYGIYNYTSAKMENIENKGVISGTGSSYGYGIYNYSGEIRKIENIGIISSTNSNYSCGIYNDSGEIGNITNIGIISGIGFNFGDGIYNELAKIGNIENTGIINGSSSSSGHGINNKAEIRDIKNTGVVSGTGDDSHVDVSGIANGGIIGDITNIGIINGTNSSSSIDVSGIYNSGTMENIINTGIINGTSSSSGNGSGINNYSYTQNFGNITNTGIINGVGSSSGNGIYNRSPAKMKNITNIGIINGSGYGIGNYSAEIKNITNTGVIYGESMAIFNANGTIGTVNNYGILANGKDQDVYYKITLSDNYGLIIQNGSKIANEDTVEEVVEDKEIKEYNDDGTVKSARKMTIKNKKVTDGSEWFTGNEKDVILNALKDTYKVTRENDNVTGSIINAYGTAIVFEGENKQLTLSGTIVNGGIDNSAAISGSDNADNGDTLILQSGEIKYTDANGVEKSATQNTIVNGNIDMKNGSDKLTVGSGTIINGNIDMGAGDDKLIVGSGTVLNGDVAMGTGNDELDIENGAVINGKLDGGIGTNSTLNFNSSTARTLNSDKINIVHSISNFKNMNINTNVTLFEKTIDTYGKETDLKVTGADEIKIGENGTLTLRIDSTNKDNLSGKIIGHALYENEGEISSTDGGKLLLALNGAGNQSIISFGDTKLNTSLVTEYEGEYYEDVTFGTTSLIHSVKRVNDTENEVEITVKKNLPLKALKYEKLNKIYHGILSVEDLIANFNVDSDEKLSTFLGYLNDIYAGNPYSYSSELSRKSVGMFRDIAVESQFKPELNKWLIMGGLTHVDGGTKDTYYGKGYYTYDIGSSDMDADTKITGAYILGEYGVSDTLTYGVVIGGNKLKSNLSNGSKVDGDALYMGAYAKKYVGNLKVTGGLGLQYGDYDADRIAVNKVASSLAEPVMKYSDNYNDMTYDIYLNGRYSHNIGNNLFLEPYGTLSYTYIKQDSADEGSKVLAIETDSKSFDYTAAKVGVDLKKVIAHEKGKSTLSAGVSYTRLLTGADEENITGRFKGENATDFDILVAHKNEHSIGLNAKYTLELENGILFDVKGSYSVERDSHNESGKNRTKGEWIIGAGLGYKF